MSDIVSQIQSFIPGVQQIFRNAGYNQQQGNTSIISGLIPRALGGTGLVSPVYASDDGGTTSPTNKTPYGPVYNGPQNYNNNSAGVPKNQSNQPQQQSNPQSNPLDDYYNQANSYYDNSINNWQNGRQSFLNTYTDPYDSLKPNVENSYKQGLNTANNQEASTRNDSQNVMDAARQMYNELSQGARSRFGGSNSAGDFAQAFMGRQFQQNAGNINNQLTNNLGNINTYRQQLGQQYNTNLQNIELQKTAALNQAQQAYNSTLQQLQQGKLGLGAQRAQNAAAALQQYQQNVANIEAAAMYSHQTNLQAALSNLQQGAHQFGVQANTTPQVAGYAAPTAYGINQSQQNTAPTIVGNQFGQKQQQQAPQITGNYNPNQDYQLPGITDFTSLMRQD